MPTPRFMKLARHIAEMEQMHPEAAEASIVRTYVEWLIDTPWSRSTKDNLDLQKAMQVLDEDHYGLEKIKERIIEYLAVRVLTDNTKG